MEKIVIVGMGVTAQDIRLFIECYQLFEIVGYAVNREYISSTQQDGLPVYALEELEQHIDKNKVGLYVAISPFHHLNREKRRVYTELKEKGFFSQTLCLLRPLSSQTILGMGTGYAILRIWMFGRVLTPTVYLEIMSIWGMIPKLETIVS